MSVINQLLLELEKRHASVAERAALPDHVRALPEGRRDYGGWWIALAAAAAVALLGTAWLAVSGLGVPRQSPFAAAPMPRTDAVIEKVVSASAAVVTDVAPREAAGDGQLRPSSRLSVELPGSQAAPQPAPSGSKGVAEPQPETAGPHAAIPASRVLGRAVGERASSAASEIAAPEAAPSSGAAAAAPKPPAAAVAVAADQPAPVVSGKTQIEKQVRQPTTRELADNEYRKAANSLHQGRLAEAQEGFRAALNLYPAHHGARQALVALLVEAKLPGEAERALQDGIKLAPEQIGFAMTLARLQVDRGDAPGATATLRGSLGHAQGSPDYVAFLAALLQRQGRQEDAIEQFQAALRLKPDTGVWWLGLAMSLQAAHRSPEAQDAYRRAKATNNLNPELAAFADQRLRQLQ
jgi:MSHA biogenesis protein MshN